MAALSGFRIERAVKRRGLKPRNILLPDPYLKVAYSRQTSTAHNVELFHKRARCGYSMVISHCGFSIMLTWPPPRYLKNLCSIKMRNAAAAGTSTLPPLHHTTSHLYMGFCSNGLTPSSQMATALSRAKCPLLRSCITGVWMAICLPVPSGLPLTCKTLVPLLE